MTDTRAIMGKQDAVALAEYLEGLTMPFTVTVKDGKPRSIPQNSTLHKWYAEIAAHYGDRTDTDVKGECHRKYGLPIRIRDVQWAWVWNNSAASLSYEKQCKVLASGVFNVSSGMTSPELKSYMDAMARDYLAAGVALTIPKDKP